MRVVRGSPILWEPVAATVYQQDHHGQIVWSQCNRFIAISKPYSGTVEVVDAVTLKRLNTFKGPSACGSLHLSFSPDSRSLIQVGDRELANWDLQTGSSVRALLSQQSAIHRLVSSTYSMDGKMVALTYSAWGYYGHGSTCSSNSDDGSYSNDDSDGSNYGGNSDGDGHDDEDHDHKNSSISISTYALLSGTHATHTNSYCIPGGRVIAPTWAHGQCLRFVAVKRGSITIWKVPFTLTRKPTKIKSFPAPNLVTQGDNHLFFPALSRLAFTLRGTIFVWDAKTSKFLLKSGSTEAPILPFYLHRPHHTPFSFGGRFFASSTTTHEIHIWKESHAGYALHRILALADMDKYTRPFFSPDGESMIVSTARAIRILLTEDQFLPPASVPTRDSRLRDFMLVFSPNEKWAAFAGMRRDVITILELQSGDLRLATVAGMKVGRLVATASTLTVLDWNSGMVTWDVSVGDYPLNDDEGINDSVLTVTLKEPTAVPLEMPPWQSSRGYPVTRDGWVMSLNGKRRLWLPHQWRSTMEPRTWSGRFLGLLHCEMAEVVILEFFD